VSPAPPPKSPLLRPLDVLALAFLGGLILLAAVAWGRGIPRGREAVQNLGLGVLLLLALRATQLVVPSRLTAFLAANAPIAMVPIDWSLDPIVDLVHPNLVDATLLAADRWLFGETPSITLEHLLAPWLTEALLFGYLSYFLILAAPLAFFWIFRDPEVHEEFARALVPLFVINLAFYILVPAIGPRFHVADAYRTPLTGLFFAERIRDLFLNVPFFRDCFPSGHTAGTLLVLIYARRRLPALFWALLPLGALCIAATVLCRFHYAIDLICALPLVFFAVQASRALSPEATDSMFARLRLGVGQLGR